MENVQNGFGLTQHQLELLHNMQIKKTEADIMTEKNSEKRALKEKWLKLWVKSLKDGIDNNSGKDAFNKYSLLIDLNKAIGEEISADRNNLVWYYISIIECELFIPYFPLGNKEEDKDLKKIKYTQKNFTAEFVNAHGVVTGEYIQRISKQYKKIIDKLDKKTMKLAMAVISTAAITALTFGVATYFAPAIAVALVGESFAGLSGIALTNACLAMLGGGAIAAGGAGIAGGVAAIAGGGAILGFAIGGTATAATAAVFWNPEYAITNIAKFELVIKEVFLNVQHDVKYSQECIAAYKAKIREMEDYIEELQRNEKENKKEIKNLAKTLSYMQRAYIELNKFCSAFDIGMQSIEE